jgi:IS1 family transposase
MYLKKPFDTLPMILTEQDLLQIDDAFIHTLCDSNPDALAELSINLVNDLKEALERLNQHPGNSSKPSGSCAPWDKHHHNDDNASLSQDHADTSIAVDESSDDTTDTANVADTYQPHRRQPGRQPGSQGFGRTQRLTVTDVEHHHCSPCSVCRCDLSLVEAASTGFDCLNVRFGDVNCAGIQLTVTRHLYYTAICPDCGFENRSQPHRAAPDNLDWEHVGLSEWRLIGPDLAALIVYLAMDMRMTRRQIMRFLFDVFGVQLSVGSIQACLLESARALAPVEQQLAEDLLDESLLYADETSHPEGRMHLWLWVFISTSTALFQIGSRSKELFQNVLDSVASGYSGWLMSDGYAVYRDYPRRLRCWAHLKRKANGLADSYDQSVKQTGFAFLEHLNQLMKAIQQAREGPNQGRQSIADDQQETLNALRQLCESTKESSHDKARALAREFLNDWDAIFRVLEHPAWPLTNNEAERALRHWVILRKISQGTRSPQGSRALALFASVITTCRLRGHSPLLYIRDVIRLRRKGEDAPRLPDSVLFQQGV